MSDKEQLKILSDNIKQCLLKNKWDALDLSTYAGISQQHIYRIINIESNPTLKTITQIANAFGYTDIRDFLHPISF